MIRNLNCFKCNVAIFNLHVSESENEKGKPGYRSQPSLVYNPPSPHFISFFVRRGIFFGGGDSTFKEKKKKSQVLNFFKTRESESSRVWVCSLHLWKKAECRLRSMGSALCFTSVSKISLKKTFLKTEKKQNKNIM